MEKLHICPEMAGCQFSFILVLVLFGLFYAFFFPQMLGAQPVVLHKVDLSYLLVSSYQLKFFWGGWGENANTPLQTFIKWWFSSSFEISFSTRYTVFSSLRNFTNFINVKSYKEQELIMPEQDFQRHFLHYNKGSASEKKRSFKNENLVIW